MFNFVRRLKKEDIGFPPYEYDLLVSLDECEYPQYLERMFKKITGEKLNLKNPKTFNEKIQWLKLYDATPLKTQLTDKVLVRDWIKEKIGEEYLKPVLQICKSFDEIDFNSLPNEFIIKTNHGCKWHYRIKAKQDFLQTEEVYSYVKSKFDGWMQQSFFPWAGFELQYKNIVPQILIEPVLLSDGIDYPIEYEIYCFNGKPMLMQKMRYTSPTVVNLYKKDYSYTPIKMNAEHIKVEDLPDENLKQAAELSKVLAKDFLLVRVDWLVCNDRFYFNEMTFTPMSGFFDFEDKSWNRELGNLLRIKR